MTAANKENEGTEGMRTMDAWLLRRASRLGHPESMIALLVLTIWIAVLGLRFGVVSLMFLVVIGWVLHAAAVESGETILNWMATIFVLTVVIATAVTYFLPPVLWAFGGACGLLYHQLVGVNAIRRRNAVVDVEVFQRHSIAILGSAALGILGAGLADAVAREGEQNWLWVPGTLAALLLLGLVLTIAPASGATPASKERWRPGERIPPQPLTADEHSLPPDERSID